MLPSMKVTFDIPDEVARKLPEGDAARERELTTDLVCGLYADSKVNSAVAARWLGVSRIQFWDELGKRQIPRQISPEMIGEDAALAGGE